MPFGVPLDDLNAGISYEIYLHGKQQPLTCVYREMLIAPGEPAKLILQPIRIPYQTIKLCIKEIEAIQPTGNRANA